MNKIFTFILGSILLLVQQNGFTQNSPLEKGWEAYDQENYKKALENFSIHLNSSPKDAKILHARATIYSFYNNYDLAFNDINSSIKYYHKKDKKGLVGAYLLRSDIYAKTNKLDKAINDAKAALKIDPGSINALLCRASYYSRKKEYLKSNEDFESVLKLDELGKKAYVGIGKNYYEQNQLNYFLITT
jgi:tetratricopeptide (TPR) repeat protein